MKKSNKQSKKLPKFKKGGNFGKNAEALGLFVADTALAEWAPNAIKQDQYDDTKFGRSLGNVASVHESFSSQSPISKNVSKMWNDGDTGMNEQQMKMYGQVQPIAKTGSKIGEMWAGQGMGQMGQIGQMGKQGMSTQYDPMANMQNPNDPNKSIYQYPNGGFTQPNAEVEKQENAVQPNGQFRQFDGPSHEQGGIETNLPQGTKIFSDKLKMPKTGKTFADLNKANDTRKEDKILSNNKATQVEKATASLMKLAKQKSSDMIFAAQESLKQSKVDTYTKRMGGIQQYLDGGYSQWRSTREKEGWVVDPRNASNAQYPAMYNPKAMSIVQDTSHDSGWNINPAKGVTDATDAYGFPNPNYYGSYTAPKQTVSGTQFKSGYTPAPGGGGYIKMGDTSTIPTHQFINGTYQPIQTNGNGGVQKYTKGGYTGFAEDPNLQEQDLSFYNQEENYNGGSSNWQDMNSPEFKQDSQNMLNRAKTSNTNSSGNNWSNMLTQAALFAANNAGNIYDLSRSNKVEKDSYGKMNPELLDPTAALRNNKQSFKNANTSLKDATAGNAGTYLSNRIASASKETIMDDEIRRTYANQNAGIKNSAQQYNIEQQKQEDIANMENRAKSRDIKANAVSNMGTNTVMQYKDTKLDKADMDRMELIKQMYPSIKHNKDLVAYYKSKYPSIKWDDIEK